MKASLFLIVFLVLNFLQHSVLSEAKSATMTINGFQNGEDGGGPSECDGKYHSDSSLIVALSTEWYHGRCGKKIVIHAGNGHSVVAKVVDECDTSRGCDTDIVDASKAVWKALGVNRNSDKYGEMHVTWNDA